MATARTHCGDIATLGPWPCLGRHPLHLKESVLTLEPVIRSAPRIGLVNIALPSMAVSDSAGVGGGRTFDWRYRYLLGLTAWEVGLPLWVRWMGGLDAGYRRVRCAKRLHKCGHKSLPGPGVSTGVARWLSCLFPQQRLCKFFGEQSRRGLRRPDQFTLSNNTSSIPDPSRSWCACPYYIAHHLRHRIHAEAQLLSPSRPVPFLLPNSKLPLPFFLAGFV